ncbi:MAG: glycosyltransferase family 2 protein [Syntrophorhabdaceae bacterium]
MKKDIEKDTRLPLSVYMITYNNGATIARALESIAGWAGEIIVVDSHSTDGTTEIASRYCDVLQFDTSDLREKYQSAHDRCMLPWLLFIDADEWLTDAFKREVEEVISLKPAISGYMADRRNIYLGREIRHGGWYPDREIRLYKKNSGSWQGGIHARIHINGQVGQLKNFYLHTPYMDIAHQIRTIDRYSEAYARDLFRAGRRFHIANILFRPVYRFFRDYIFKLGFLDGVPGIIIMAGTLYYVFMKHARLWEIEKDHEGGTRVQE